MTHWERSSAIRSAPTSSRALVAAAGILEKCHPAAGGPPRFDVGIGVADHPRSGTVDGQHRCCLPQKPRLRLAASACARELWRHAGRMMGAQAGATDTHGLLCHQIQHLLMDRHQLVQRCLALRRCGLVRYAYEHVPSVGELLRRCGGAGNELHVGHCQRRLGRACCRVRHRLVEDSIAVQEDGAAQAGRCGRIGMHERERSAAVRLDPCSDHGCSRDASDSQ